MSRWIGSVVVSRTMKKGRRDGRTVRLQIGRPRRALEGDWECRYELLGLGRTRRTRVFGVDGLHALILGLVAIRSELEREGAALRWLNSPAYRGVPEQVSMVLPEDAAKRVSRFIAREEKRFREEANRRYEKRVKKL